MNRPQCETNHLNAKWTTLNQNNKIHRSLCAISSLEFTRYFFAAERRLILARRFNAGKIGKQSSRRVATPEFKCRYTTLWSMRYSPGYKVLKSKYANHKEKISLLMTRFC
jgi:hypothetical protein